MGYTFFMCIFKCSQCFTFDFVHDLPWVLFLSCRESPPQGGSPKKDKVGANWHRERKWMEISITKKAFTKVYLIFSPKQFPTQSLGEDKLCECRVISSEINRF